MNKSILTFPVVAALMISACTKTDSVTSLKESIHHTATEINNAAAAISATQGFQLMEVSASAAKSGSEYSDSITLGLIAGIYAYAPDTTFFPSMSSIPHHLFRKTGTSDIMIVNMPKKLIWHPKYLFDFYHAHDSAYNHNNFTISASDYHYYYSFNKFDYKLAADFSLDRKDIGSLDLISKAGSFADRSYSSTFKFTQGLSVNVEFQGGDTTQTSFSLSDPNGILLKETNIFTGSEFHHFGERQYILTIGNIDIKKTTGIDSIQVFLDGVLQKTAAARIIDSAATTGSICHQRDLQLTFDDGTTTNLSKLISPAMSTLRTLTDSMHSMYFAKNIIDYIAFNIYYHQYKINHRP